MPWYGGFIWRTGGRTTGSPTVWWLTIYNKERGFFEILNPDPSQHAFLMLPVGLDGFYSKEWCCWLKKPSIEVRSFLEPKNVINLKSWHFIPSLKIGEISNIFLTMARFLFPCCIFTHGAKLLPTELNCTLLSHAAPSWATLHPNELRCTLLSYVAPY
jgi:hypothetical protein